MKQSIYQKLLLSLTMMMFFATMTSAQVLTKSQLNHQKTQTQDQQMMDRLKAKAEAAGLDEVPAEWIQLVNEKMGTNNAGSVEIPAGKSETKDSSIALKSKMVRHQQVSKTTLQTDVDKSPEKYRQEVIQKMNAANNEEDRKKYKAILESLN